jgi:hypothetical protein
MKIQIETNYYNQRRYGKPWIAIVDFSDDGTANFNWGNWVGENGQDGILIIDVSPGDIVARGQKDHYKPRNSAPAWYRIDSAGNLMLVDSKKEAYKLYQEAKEAKEEKKQ